MKKSKILKILYISILFSVIFILLSYFSIIRYFILHFKSSDSYAKNYKNLDKAKDSKVIIALTTTEDKINTLNPTINSLLDQTVRVDEISLCIPYSLKGKVPKDIENIVWQQNFVKDYGELNAVIPPLLKLEDENDILIIVQDDQIYGSDFVEEMINVEKKNPNSIIFGKKDCVSSGVLLKPNYIKSDFEKANTKNIKEWLKNYSIKPEISANYHETYKKF